MGRHGNVSRVAGCGCTLGGHSYGYWLVCGQMQQSASCILGIEQCLHGDTASFNPNFSANPNSNPAMSDCYIQAC